MKTTKPTELELVVLRGLAAFKDEVRGIDLAMKLNHRNKSGYYQIPRRALAGLRNKGLATERSLYPTYYAITPEGRAYLEATA